MSTLSGPIGANLVPMLQGAQLWAKAVNAHGGLNEHSIQIFPMDDGAEPGRHAAAIKDLVENKHVIAFINNVEFLTGDAGVDYLEAKRVPVIGLSGTEHHAYTRTMFFPQMTSAEWFYTAVYAGIAQQSLRRGLTRLGVLMCSEAPQCSEFGNSAGPTASRRGMHVVYQGRATVAQPDFTAECLSARNAGVEVMFVGMDTNSISRVAASCARQGFRPLFATAAQAINDTLRKVESFSLVTNVGVFPFFQGTTPATAEFRAAWAQYGPTIQPSGSLTIGWVSGKLLEAASGAITEPPTSDALLNGLWSIKGNDLGGLTQPLTFTRGKAATPMTCWFNIVLEQGKWASPDGFRRSCE